MNTAKFKKYLNIIHDEFKLLFGFFTQTPVYEIMNKYDAENCLTMGVYGKNEELVDYGIRKHPETINNVNFHTVSDTTLPIIKKLIDAGYDPFPLKHGLFLLKKYPHILEVFLQKGMSFEHVFSEIPDEDPQMVETLKMAGLTGETQPLVGFLQPFIDYYHKTNNTLALNDAEKSDNIKFLDILFKYQFFESNFYKKLRPILKQYLSFMAKGKGAVSLEFLENISEKNRIHQDIKIENPTKKSNIL